MIWKMTLQDIHIGDYVQAYSTITKKFAPPMYVTAIFDDGLIYLNIAGNEGDPFEENITDTYSLPITKRILKYFGFRKNGLGYVLHCVADDIAITFFGRYLEMTVNGQHCRQFRKDDGIHSLQSYFYNVTLKRLTFDY